MVAKWVQFSMCTHFSAIRILSLRGFRGFRSLPAIYTENCPPYLYNLGQMMFFCDWVLIGSTSMP